MATELFTLKEGDLKPYLPLEVVDHVGDPEKEAPVDLSTAQKIVLVARLSTAKDPDPAKIEAEADITDAAKGLGQYVWQAGDTDTPGTYNCEVKVFDAEGKPESFPNKGFFQFVIEEDATEK